MSDIERVREVEVVQVIRVKSLVGEGVEGSVARMVTQYWSFTGILLAEIDPENLDQ